MITIEKDEFQRLLKCIQNFINHPDNKAAQFLALSAIRTLQLYDIGTRVPA